MRVRELMSTPVTSCRPQDSLEHAAKLLWEHDCGVLPVVDSNGSVGAAITDRDICMGAYTRGKKLSDLRVRDSMSREISVCRADEDVARAAESMRKSKIRRLPVVDEAGKLVGVISLNDIARAATHDAAMGRELVQTLASVCAPHPKRAAVPQAKAHDATLAAAHRA